MNKQQKSCLDYFIINKTGKKINCFFKIIKNNNTAVRVFIRNNNDLYD